MNDRTRTSSLITTDEGRTILIDATTDLRTQALKHDVRNVHAVFYTHAHSDHILGTDDLRVFNFAQHAPIPIYGSPGTLAEVISFFPYIFKRDPAWAGGMIADLIPSVIEPYDAFELFGARIQTFSLEHGRCEVSGIRIGELAYATDCNAIPDRSYEILRGVRYLFLDGLRDEPHPTHLTIAQAVREAEKIGAEMTYLIHMSHNLDYHETNARLPKHVQLAYDGLEIEFGTA